MCTTEIGRLALKYKELESKGVKLATLSCDPVTSHQKWPRRRRRALREQGAEDTVLPCPCWPKVIGLHRNLSQCNLEGAFRANCRMHAPEKHYNNGFCSAACNTVNLTYRASCVAQITIDFPIIADPTREISVKCASLTLKLPPQSLQLLFNVSAHLLDAPERFTRRVAHQCATCCQVIPDVLSVSIILPLFLHCSHAAAHLVRCMLDRLATNVTAHKLMVHSAAPRYGMLDPNIKDKEGLPLTCRAVFIVGPDKKLKLSLNYPASVGRNMDEIVRVIDALQLSAKYSVVRSPRTTQHRQVPSVLTGHCCWQHKCCVPNLNMQAASVHP